MRNIFRRRREAERSWLKSRIFSEISSLLTTKMAALIPAKTAEERVSTILTRYECRASARLQLGADRVREVGPWHVVGPDHFGVVRWGNTAASMPSFRKRRAVRRMLSPFTRLNSPKYRFVIRFLLIIIAFLNQSTPYQFKGFRFCIAPALDVADGA